MSNNEVISVLQKNLKKFRQEKGLSQLKLSIMTELSKDYITSIENGRRVPTIKKLIVIANALNIDVYKLFIEHVV